MKGAGSLVTIGFALLLVSCSNSVAAQIDENEPLVAPSATPDPTATPVPAPIITPTPIGGGGGIILLAPEQLYAETHPDLKGMRLFYYGLLDQKLIDVTPNELGYIRIVGKSPQGEYLAFIGSDMPARLETTVSLYLFDASSMQVVLVSDAFYYDNFSLLWLNNGSFAFIARHAQTSINRGYEFDIETGTSAAFTPDETNVRNFAALIAAQDSIIWHSTNFTTWISKLETGETEQTYRFEPRFEQYSETEFSPSPRGGWIVNHVSEYSAGSSTFLDLESSDGSVQISSKDFLDEQRTDKSYPPQNFFWSPGEEFLMFWSGECFLWDLSKNEIKKLPLGSRCREGNIVWMQKERELILPLQGDSGDYYLKISLEDMSETMLPFLRQGSWEISPSPDENMAVVSDYYNEPVLVYTDDFSTVALGLPDSWIEYYRNWIAGPPSTYQLTSPIAVWIGGR